jgi:hypothetical protein
VDGPDMGMPQGDTHIHGGYAGNDGESFVGTSIGGVEVDPTGLGYTDIPPPGLGVVETPSSGGPVETPPISGGPVETPPISGGPVETPPISGGPVDTPSQGDQPGTDPPGVYGAPQPINVGAEPGGSAGTPPSQPPAIDAPPVPDQPGAPPPPVLIHQGDQPGMDPPEMYGIPPRQEPINVGPEPGGSGGTPLGPAPQEQNMPLLPPYGDSLAPEPGVTVDQLVALSTLENLLNQSQPLPPPLPPGASNEPDSIQAITPEQEEEARRVSELNLRIEEETAGMGPAEKAMVIQRALSEVAADMVHHPLEEPSGEEAIHYINEVLNQIRIQTQIEEQFRHDLNNP